jgi:HlyD family secretion protein
VRPRSDIRPGDTGCGQAYFPFVQARRVVLAIAAGGIVAGTAFWAVRPPLVPVVHPTAGPVTQTVVVSGQVMPPAEIRLAALVSSNVKELLAREGDTVRAGQVLLRLDEADARAGLAQADANLAAARAGKSELVRLSGPEAETSLRRAETNLADTKRRFDREQNLFRAGASTEVMLEEAKTAMQLSEAQREAALLQLRAASSGGTRAQSATATIALAEAQLARARVQLERHEVRAPSDGIIVTRSVEPGDAVFSGSNLFILSATGQTRLRVEPDERNLALLALGQSAIASAEAFPDRPFDAKVSYIAPAIDPTRGTVEIRLLVPSPPEFLRPSMTVSVEIVVAHKDDALLVPRSSVYAEKADPHVLTLIDGTARKKPVVLGLLGDDRVEVQSGLTAADTIIQAAPGSVSVGAAVRAAPAP